MKYRYRIRTDAMYSEDGTRHTTYGIEAVDCYGFTCARVRNVFLNKDKANEFIALCNASDLSLIHLYEVLEDIL